MKVAKTIKYKKLTKEYLAGLISKNVASFTQAEAARMLGIAQPEVSRIIQRKLEHISMTKLLSLSELAGFEITVTINPK